MKILQIYFISIFLLVSVQGFSQEWELTWSDEFDKDGPPDPAKWIYEKGFVRNAELQYYTKRPENVRVLPGDENGGPGCL